MKRMTFSQLIARFKTEDDCKTFLVERRWPDGVHCPRCGNGFLHRYRSTADIIMMWREGCSAFVELRFANDRVVLDAEVRYERALGRRS